METNWCAICKRAFNPEVEHQCVWDIQDTEIARHDLERWLKEFEVDVEAQP